jgi:hypothetical protein
MGLGEETHDLLVPPVVAGQGAASRDVPGDVLGEDPEHAGDVASGESLIAAPARRGAQRSGSQGGAMSEQEKRQWVDEQEGLLRRTAYEVTWRTRDWLEAYYHERHEELKRREREARELEELIRRLRDAGSP